MQASLGDEARACYLGGVIRRLLILIALPLAASDHSREPLSATQTETFHPVAAGSIRLENSFGEVDIEGWDRPDVEITITRSTERDYSAGDRAEAQRRLESVKIGAKQDGNDVVITTSFPPRSVFLHPLARRSDVLIHYEIRAPRASRLIVHHNSGGVNVNDLRGGVDASVINGQIDVTLAPGEYSIDAESKLGRVYSDFEGSERSRRVLGEDFSAGGKKPELMLRVRYGDIMILKLTGPPAGYPSASSPGAR